MKFRSLLLNGVATWLLYANSAEAAPVAAAISAVAGLLSAGGVVGAVAQLVFGMALSYGVSAIQKALAKKQQRQAEPRGVALDVRLGDDQPAQFIVGTYATAGIRKYTGTWGQASKTPNAFLTDVLELSCIPHPGLAGIWIDDTKGTILWNEPHPDGRGCPIQEYRVGGTDYAWVRFVDGTQTVADPWLTAKFGSHPERPFKATMIGRSCAFAVVTYRYNAEKFGGLPAVLFEMLPMPLYDLRKDSTNGGSGPQRWNDRSTWAPSDNNAVVIYNLVRGIYHGDEWVYGGQNLSAFRLPASNWIAAANECDRLVDNAAGGQEKQFRCGYEVRLDMEPLSVIDDIRQGCAGRIAEVGGIFKMLAGAPGAAVYSFTDDDILVTEDQSFEPFPSLSETHNGIEATYPEPAEKWASKDAPARYSSALEADDGNRRLATGIEFPAVPFGRQVQTLMKVMIEEERRFRTHLFHLPPDAFALEPNDAVSWSSSRNGYANKKFLVDRILGKFTFNQLVRLKEIDPSDYGWQGSDELPTDIGWLGPIVAPSQPMYGWTVEPYEVKDSAGVARRPSIKVSCSPDQDDVKNVLVEVRLKSSQEVVFQSDATAYASPYSWVLPGTFLPNTQYEVRGKFVPYSNRPTEWSNWITVTTPNILIAAVDILDNAITAQKIADAAVTADKIMNEAITSLKLAAEAVTTAKIQVGAIDALRLADNSVVANKIANAAVTGAKIADAAITGTKIVDLAITETKIANDAISTPKLQANAITADKLQANSVTAGKIAANAVTATALAADSVTARSLVLTDFSNIADNGWQTGTLDGWTTSFLQGFVLDTGAGDASGWRIHSVGRDQAFSNHIACTPGEQYYVEAWVYNTDASSANLYMFTWDAAGTGGFAASPVATTTLKNQWIKLQGIATVPAGKGRIALCLQTDRVAGTGTYTLWSKPVMRRASAAELIVDGAVYAKHMSVGSGKNMLPNTENYGGTQDWSYWNQGGIANRQSATRLEGDTWALTGQPMTVVLEQHDGNAANEVQQWTCDRRVPVKAGSRYEAYAFLGSHRCQHLVAIAFYDSNGAGISEASTGWINAQVQGGNGKPLSNYTQSGLFAIAPANAATALFYVRKSPTLPGQVNSFMHIVRPYLGEAYPNQAQFSPWEPGGITTIGADYIRTGAVIAGKIAANAVTAGTIAAGAVTAEKIAASAVTADKIAANTIAGNHIVAGAISASKLVLTDFSNMADNGWQRGSLEAWWTSYMQAFYFNPNEDGGNAAGYVLQSLGRECAISQRIACSPGEAYFFDVWVNNSDAGSANILAMITDGNGGNTAWLFAASTNLKNQWVRLQGRVTVPTGRTYIQMMLMTDRTGGTGTSTYWSKPVMRRAAGAELIVDGAITANKLSVNSLSAISANFGDAYFSGIARSVNGKLLLDFNNGGIEVFT